MSFGLWIKILIIASLVNGEIGPMNLDPLRIGSLIVIAGAILKAIHWGIRYWRRMRKAVAPITAESAHERARFFSVLVVVFGLAGCALVLLTTSLLEQSQPSRTMSLLAGVAVAVTLLGMLFMLIGEPIYDFAMTFKRDHPVLKQKTDELLAENKHLKEEIKALVSENQRFEEKTEALLAQNQLFQKEIRVLTMQNQHLGKGMEALSVQNERLREGMQALSLQHRQLIERLEARLGLLEAQNQTVASKHEFPVHRKRGRLQGGTDKAEKKSLTQKNYPG